MRDSRIMVSKRFDQIKIPRMYIPFEDREGESIVTLT